MHGTTAKSRRLRDSELFHLLIPRLCGWRQCDFATLNVLPRRQGFMGTCNCGAANLRRAK